MKAIVIERPGGPEVLKLQEVDRPAPGHGEVRVRIHATAINRADVLQRTGHYPAPADAPADIPGVEFAGEVDEVGSGVEGLKVGDRVFGLAGGGTYAEYVIVHHRAVAIIPERLDYIAAAAIPEVFITAYDALVPQCQLKAGEQVLIHAVGSGVGVAAVQIACALSAISTGTARTSDKIDRAKEYGLSSGIVTKEGNFADQVMEQTGGRGVDVVLELVGGSYVAEDIRCMSPGGRIVVVGLVAGTRCDLDLGLLLRKRLVIRGTALRARPLEEKIAAIQLLSRNMVPLFERGILKPVVDMVLPLAQAPEAHRHMEGNLNFGKIVLTCS